jgi:hypothetical protein
LSENPTFPPSAGEQDHASKSPVLAGLFEKAAKDRKINVETPANYCQVFFKQKANDPAIIWQDGNSGLNFRIKIGKGIYHRALMENLQMKKPILFGKIL